MRRVFHVGTFFAVTAICGTAAHAAQNPPTTENPAPGQVVETTETTTISADGTRTITKKTVTKSADTGSGEKGQGREIQPDESGLKHPIRLSVGGFKLGSQDTFRQAVYDYYGDHVGKTSGFSAKLDYSFFRPTRHEAMFAFNYFKSPNSGGSDVGELLLEYRWRFADEGRAYYGINIGGGYDLNSGRGYSSQSYFLSGSAIGYEFGPRIFVEARYTYEPDTQDDIGQLMLGVRF